jgi:hypothetical protein
VTAERSRPQRVKQVLPSAPVPQSPPKLAALIRGCRFPHGGPIILSQSNKGKGQAMVINP